MKIGLVLSKTPGYSETFFRSKIAGLGLDNEVLLFVSEKAVDFRLCKVYMNPRFHKNRIVFFVFFVLKLFRLAFFSPKSLANFYRLERKSGRSFRNAIENIYINSSLLMQRLDWVHFGFATLALRRENVAKAIGAKMAVSLRGFDIGIYPIKNPGCYRLLWEKVDKVHVISNDLKQLALQDGLPKNKEVKKITPAIDINHFSSKWNPKPINYPIKILTVARLHWKKGLEHTIEALSLLKGKNIPFLYKIIGDGNDYERLQFAVNQLNVSENVIFCGRQPHSFVKTEMERADVYIQYSIQEGFCNSVLEAQALGLLCIVSNAEGLPENILDNVSGWIVPKRRPDLLAEKIIEVLGSPFDSLNIIRKTAIERVRSEFNLDKQKAEFLDFYQDS